MRNLKTIIRVIAAIASALLGIFGSRGAKAKGK